LRGPDLIAHGSLDINQEIQIQMQLFKTMQGLFRSVLNSTLFYSLNYSTIAL
jgi:hypothetical protein